VVDRAKTRALLDTQLAATDGVPAMDNVAAATWCNSTVVCRINIPIETHRDAIGDERGCQAKLIDAWDAHRAGTTVLDAVTFEAVTNLLATMGYQMAGGSVHAVLADTPETYAQLEARLDAVVTAGIYKDDAGDSDKDATLALTDKQVRLCDLDPYTVDLDPYERRGEHWLDGSIAIGFAHVEQARALPAAAGTGGG